MVLPVLFPGMLRAQILDDSTRLRYSDRTVRYRTEAGCIENQRGMMPDTGLNEFSEKGDFLYQTSGMFQNLGVFGSASRPLFLRLPGRIGLRYGMEAFDALVPGATDIRYYRTLSPYTSLFYNQGSRRRSMLQATASVNIRPAFNVSAAYQRFTSMRVLNVTSAEQRQTDHHSAWISTHYQDSTDRFRIWGHYQHLNHLQYETGGADLSRIPGGDSLFTNSDIMPVRLGQDARNRQIRNRIYLAQMFRLGRNGFWLRSWHSRSRQSDFYNDPRPRTSYYGPNRLYFQKSTAGEISDTLYSERRFQQVENGAVLLYIDSMFRFEAGVRHAFNRYVQNIQTLQRVPDDLIYLGEAIWKPGKGIRAGISAAFRDAGEWDFGFKGTWAGWEGRVRAMRYRPTVLQHFFVSRNLLYERELQPVTAWNLQVSKAWKAGTWTLRPGWEALKTDRGIFFDTTFSPQQAGSPSLIQYLSLQISGPETGRFHTRNTFIRTLTSGPRISGMPGYVYRSAHWFDLVRSRKAYAVQIGFNLDWRFDWISEEYYPLTGQWILQDRETIAPYFLFDAFAHIRIDRVRIYFKVHNTLQGLGGAGYLAAPGMPGQRRLLEFGLNWSFFD